MAWRKTFSLFFTTFFILMIGCSNDISITRHVVDTIHLPPVTPNVHVQIWEQPVFVDGTDIIWVIDRSCSMLDDDPKIVTGIEGMMAALPENEDWRLAIVSTDPNEARDNNQYPLNTFSTIDDVWASYDALGEPPYETGFDSIITYVDDGSYAETWMRPEAFMQLVVVSDEDDSGPTGPSGFIDWVNDFNAYSFSAIVGQPNIPCNGVSSAGVNYIEVVNETNGITVDFCDDWALAVKDLASQTALTEEFILDAVPDTNTLFVTVNGADNELWRYDTQLNAIIFDTPTDWEDLILIAYATPYEAPVQ